MGLTQPQQLAEEMEIIQALIRTLDILLVNVGPQQTSVHLQMPDFDIYSFLDLSN
jgi:hypothetical protein